MHELSIAQSIIEIAEEYSEKKSNGFIKKIDIEIGRLSGVEIEALDFALEVSVKNTILEKAKYNLISLPGKATCRNCDKSFEIDHFFDVCPHCKSLNREIIEGKEMTIKSINF